MGWCWGFVGRLLLGFWIVLGVVCLGWVFWGCVVAVGVGDVVWLLLRWLVGQCFLKAVGYFGSLFI